MAPFTKASVVRGYVERFPNTTAHTLARIIYRENPSLFTNLESARTAVRYTTGSLGNEHRKYMARKDLVKTRSVGDPFAPLPKGITSFNTWEAVEVPGPIKALLLSDVHAPYHDHAALELALRFGEDQGVDTIILNGDLADFFSVSFWEKDPRKRNLAAELQTVRDLLYHIRQRFPLAKMIYKVGNHEERWERYLSVKAPELLGVEDFELRKLLRLDDFETQIVSDKRPLKLGYLYVIHGHEFKWGISNPVNPARGFYLRAKECCIGGHLHQTSSHSEKSLGGTIISTWSTGALCDLHPDYAPINKWNHGFAIIDTEANGQFEVNNLKIIEGRVFKD